MAYFSKATTSSPASLAEPFMTLAMASGKRSLRARIATRLTSGILALTSCVSGVVRVAFGVKVPKRNL